MKTDQAIAIGLALASTTLTNLAYLREHGAVVALPPLSPSHPWRSLRLLLGDRDWLIGFAMESGGWALYTAALALGSLALVQSAAAGGIGVLAFATQRMSRHRLSPSERAGVILSFFGLLALGVSLAGGASAGTRGSVVPIALWLGGSAVLAGLAYSAARLLGAATADAVAGGLLFSIGDISTKIATQGGARVLFALPLIGGYVLGTSLIQLGYQRGSALTVAGTASLLTTALPIVAGTVLLNERVPHDGLGVLRVLAFVAVSAGAILLSTRSQDDRPRGALPSANGCRGEDQRGLRPADAARSG